MKAYKGFNKKLQCRDFQYELGGEYEEPKAELCQTGFHACKNPIEVFYYYPPESSRYCEVELEDVTGEKGNDSKVCGRKIKIGAEIGIKGIIDAFVKSALEKVDWKNNKIVNTGYRSVSTNTGDCSASTNAGDRSISINTGDCSASTDTGCRSISINTGCYGVATNTGDYGISTVENKESIAIATGLEGKAKGELGCYIVLAEWEWGYDCEWHLKTVKSHKVDGEVIKPNTFYTLKNGTFIEVD